MHETIRWNDNIAELWKKVVPPSRPAISELDIYSEYLRTLQKKVSRKLDVLVLGSTTEFRDWGYENNCNVFVIDYCREYYNKISKGLKYKNALNCEKVFFTKWQDMTFNNKFDIVIGDLATGNVPFKKLNTLFEKVYLSLRRGGFFLGKSMCYNPNQELQPIKSVINSYTKLNIKDHPYTHIFYELAIHYIDPKTHIWNNQQMFNDLKQLYSEKQLEKRIFDALSVVGSMNVNFVIPPYDTLLDIGTYFFNLLETRYGKEAYSKNFPLYIFQK